MKSDWCSNYMLQSFWWYSFIFYSHLVTLCCQNLELYRPVITHKIINDATTIFYQKIVSLEMLWIPNRRTSITAQTQKLFHKENLYHQFECLSFLGPGQYFLDQTLYRNKVTSRPPGSFQMSNTSGPLFTWFKLLSNLEQTMSCTIRISYSFNDAHS